MIKDWLDRRRQAPPRAHISQERRESFWLRGGLPACIQAFCALSALVLAVFAYSSWKEQEAAKRKADIAMDAIKSVHAAAQCFTNATRAKSIRDMEYKSLASFAQKGIEDIEACQPHFAALRALVPIAKLTLDDQIAGRLEVLARFMGLRSVNLKMLQNTVSIASDHPDADEATKKRYAAQ